VRAEAAAQAEPLALVDTLERLTNAVAVDQSKAGDLAPEPVPAEPALQLPDRPGLAMDDSMAEAARATLYFHWRRLLYHEPEARKGADPEALHDMRVATRRMRAAMQMFEAYVGTKRLAPFVKGMRRTGQILGAVRDLDVFHEKAQLYLDSLPASQAHDLDPLLTVWQAQRDASRKDMLAYLDSGRFQRFRTEFGQFLKEPDLAALSVFTRGGQPIPYRLRHVVPWVVQRRVATVRAFGEWVTGSDVPLERLHRLRIACKRLRYALEFFEEVLASDVDDLIEEMKKLQDHLGNLQDAVVACNLLRDFLTWGTWGHAASQDSIWPTAPIVAPGVATYMAFRQKEIQELVKAFPQQWERLQSPEFGSKLEKVLAVLW
jgi:CHAD domain-containing protein